uniref:Uncharacterized protein n=1 Tax=Arundo donax TaxID=35708 RepID=A0A0A9BK89_ARUDO
MSFIECVSFLIKQSRSTLETNTPRVCTVSYFIFYFAIKKRFASGVFPLYCLLRQLGVLIISHMRCNLHPHLFGTRLYSLACASLYHSLCLSSELLPLE